MMGLDPGPLVHSLFHFPLEKYVGSAGEYVGSVSGIGSGDFVQIVIESFGDVVMLVMFIPIGV